MVKKFLRRIWSRHSKLGKKRKKKQIWRKPTGRDNKMREKRRGYPSVVSIGYKKDKKVRGKIEEKNPILIKNVKDLEILKQNEIGILGNVGKKKKIEIIKKANEKKISLYNVNVKNYLKEIERQTKKKQEKKIEEKKSEKKTKTKKPEKDKKTDEKHNTKDSKKNLGSTESKTTPTRGTDEKDSVGEEEK